LDKLGPAGLYKMLSAYDDKSAYAMTILAYQGSEEEEPLLFVGKTDGEIVPPRGPTDFGWDPCFEPKDYLKLTYAEMSKEDKNKISHRSRAFQEMIKHFAIKSAPVNKEVSATEKN